MSDNNNLDPLATSYHPSPSARLSMQNLGKRYGKRWVVKDVSFSVEQGQVVGLLRAKWCRQNHQLLYGGRTGQYG